MTNLARVAALAILAPFVSAQTVNVIKNGSFETHSCGRIAQGTCMKDWLVTPSHLNFILTNVTSDGRVALEFCRDDAVPMLSQTVPLVRKQRYTLLFDLASHDRARVTNKMFVRVNGSTRSFDIPVRTAYKTFRIPFVAAENSTTVEFSILGSSSPDSGILLDNVRLLGPPAGPDLIIERWDMPQRMLHRGDDALLTVVHRNVGGLMSPAMRTGYVLSQDRVWDASDRSYGSNTIIPIDSGKRHEYVVRLPIDRNTRLGRHYFGVFADVLRQVAETDETNNTSFFAITVAQRFDGSAGDRLGHSVSDAGDVNGDGFGDVIIGSPRASYRSLTNPGLAQVISGRDNSVLHTLITGTSRDGFGFVVSGAGDVNGDGTPDLIVGAPDEAAFAAGYARILSGRDGRMIGEYVGTGSGTRFGYSVAGAGDVNGDGFGEVIVGAPLADGNGRDSGSAYVYSGKDGRLLHEFRGGAGEELGWSVDGAGDVNADGYHDVVVGSQLGEAALVYSGKDGAILHTLKAPALSKYGWSVAGAGDVNCDGHADVVVGAPGSFGLAGAVQVRSGKDGAVLYETRGFRSNDNLGWSVSGAGDTNGDGYADVIAGAPTNSASGKGYALVVSGRDGTTLERFESEVPGDAFGSSVSGAGDVDDDGFANVIVGSWKDDASGMDAGRARLFGIGGRTHATRYTFDGTATGDDRLGFSASGAGDVNADGHADVVFGAPLHDRGGKDTGRVVIRSGKDGSQLREFFGAAAGDQFGFSVSDAGDVNCDGRADIIVGSPGHASYRGRAQVFSGSDGTALHTFDGGATNDDFGASVAGAGDVNGDGFSDVIVGSPQTRSTGQGYARVFSGIDGKVLHTFRGDAFGDWFGFAVAGAGDVDADGHADLIVGAHFDDNNGQFSGSARVFSGKDGKILFTFNGDSSRDYLGYSVSGAGDVDGDGHADVIAGALGDDDNGNRSGSARVYSGKNGAVLYTLRGDSAGAEFGYSVAGVGDTNCDGYSDFIVGARVALANGQRTGIARIFSGRDGAKIAQFDGDEVGSLFGFSVSGAGDVNADGRPDVVVGAPIRGRESGRAYVITSRHFRKPGKVEVYGRPCADSRGFVSRIGGIGTPTVGERYTVTMRGTPSPSAGILLIGHSRSSLPFGTCRLLTFPFVIVLNITTAGVETKLPLPIPNDPGFVGVRFNLQAALWDAAKLALITGDAAEIEIGDRFPR